MTTTQILARIILYAASYFFLAVLVYAVGEKEWQDEEYSILVSFILAAIIESIVWAVLHW